MKRILYLLLILLIVGILWIGSKYWEFSEESYVNKKFLEKTIIFTDSIDLELLKKDFAPANEL